MNKMFGKKKEEQRAKVLNYENPEKELEDLEIEEDLEPVETKQHKEEQKVEEQPTEEYLTLETKSEEFIDLDKFAFLQNLAAQEAELIISHSAVNPLLQEKYYMALFNERLKYLIAAHTKKLIEIKKVIPQKQQQKPQIKQKEEVAPDDYLED